MTGEDHYTWDGRLLDEPEEGAEPAEDAYTEGLILDALVTERERIATFVESQYIELFAGSMDLLREVAAAIRRGEYGR